MFDPAHGKITLMALLEYKITFKDGSSQPVKASQQAEEGTFLVFYDGLGEVYRAPAANIESVSRADVADREKRSIRTAAV